MRISAQVSLMVFVLALTLMGCSTLATPAGTSPRASQAQTPEPQASALQASGRQQTLANGAVVDGVRIGIPVGCVTGPDCATRLSLAKAAAIARHGLAPTSIGAAQFFMPYVTPGATLGSGGGAIVVFDLADGSRAAVYTYCFDTCMVVAPQPVQPLTLESPSDHGPLVDPLVDAPRDCSSDEHPMCNDAVRVAIASATTSGFLAPDSIADAHYYVVYLTPDSAEAAASKADYIVDIYVAGTHETLAETAIGVSCGSGPCHVVSPQPSAK